LSFLNKSSSLPRYCFIVFGKNIGSCSLLGLCWA
jgi:hypothetical protein